MSTCPKPMEPAARTFFVLLIICATISTAGCEERQETAQPPSQNQTAQAPADLPPAGSRPIVGGKPPMPDPVSRPTLDEYQVQTIASGLVVPWDIAFASSERAYITERPGRVRLILNGRLQPGAYATVNVIDSGEGGLMGIALHPNYPTPRQVYLMYTYRADGRIYNRISRFTDTGNGLTNETPVVTRIPASGVHNGGIIRFGPDGMLYAGTGDAGERELAQNRSSLAGKILRMTSEGRPPADNPFPDSLVYAYGFRNVQGLAWNPANGDLWATNHGPTGEAGLRAMDSIYIVEKGGNHGWPRVLGVTDRRGVVDPILFFREVAVPPGLATFYNADQMPNLKGDFFFASLRGEALYRVTLSGPRTISRIERWWQTGTHRGQYGRLRAVVQGPDGALYVSTSNRSRGQPRSGDDRILRISSR
jgi:aldose sugar dehydrogenase